MCEVKYRTNEIFSLYVSYDNTVYDLRIIVLIYGKEAKMEKSVFTKFKVCKSVHHHAFKINQPTRCNSFSDLLFDIYSYVQLNMFRA
jgi:hypothetical protein